MASDERPGSVRRLDRPLIEAKSYDIVIGPVGGAPQGATSSADGDQPGAPSLPGSTRRRR